MKLRRFWRQYAPENGKRSWSQAAPEDSKSAPEEIVLLKNSAPEDKRSRSRIIRSCIIRSCIIRSCLIRSHFTRSWRSTGFAKHSKIEESTLQKLSIGFENTAENQWNIATVISKVFEGMCLQFGRKRWHCTLYELYNHVLHYSVLCLHFKTRKQLQNTVSPAYMFLWIRNGFQIGSS